MSRNVASMYWCVTLQNVCVQGRVTGSRNISKHTGQRQSSRDSASPVLGPPPLSGSILPLMLNGAVVKQRGFKLKLKPKSHWTIRVQSWKTLLLLLKCTQAEHNNARSRLINTFLRWYTHPCKQTVSYLTMKRFDTFWIRTVYSLSCISEL